MSRLVETIKRVAVSGSPIERDMVEGAITRSHWGIEEETVKPVDEMVRSMRKVARKGEQDRAFVGSIARHFGRHIAAQFGPESLRKAEVDYGDGVTDARAIRRFGFIVRWALDKPGTDVSVIASLTMDTVRVQLSSRNQPANISK